MTMTNEATVLVVIIQTLAILSVLFVYASRYKRVSPDKAMVVYGRQMHPGVKIGFMVISGGGKFILPIIEEVQHMDLGLKETVMELDHVRTAPGQGSVPVRVVLALMYRVSSDKEGVYKAAVNLLGKTNEDIKRMVEVVVEGTVRETATDYSPRDLDVEREGFGTRVGSLVAQDLHELGIEVRCLNIVRVIHKGVDRIG
jgi:flotillin